ncbi:uncharacterized protein EV420DRAFT_1650408 [Desarmillaria tabescens]|uniref:Uncharacterized protein n=1 Tax=Armillaria tabescens TaxID=1929756 RepID=A0AA39MMW2_ARMTA|nr:uncharacterized protein EV420DRAFT_1650408 [Desarmillaria tabescens]KAK0440656.1 hypothetical protein EV420DRAFT_1650408 [Desarmillaria tabescens]
MNRIFIFILFLLFISPTFGAPISPGDNQDLPASSEYQRTVWNIIWSCLVTMFACTWFAIHPNVPGRNVTTKGAISCTIQRARLMIMAILAPEIIVGWATTQFTVAWRVRHGENISIASVKRAWREKADESKPTLAHGFFLSMGGFYYTPMPPSVYEDLLDRTRNPDILLRSKCSWDNEDIRGVLVDVETLESEPRLAKTLAAISAETIEDKSKGDPFSKTISILQISWFIVKCIARAVQHLPITLLEMATLAFAGFSIITYFLWWHKPLNVQYHISLDGLNLSETMRTLATTSCKESTSPKASSGDGVIDALPWVYTVVAKFFLLGPADGHDNIGDGALPLDAGKSNSMAVYMAWAMPLVVMGFVGSFLGTFHSAYMASSFYFPSHTEMVLWRFSSAAATIGFLAVAILTFIDEAPRPKWTSKLPRLLRSWLTDPSIFRTIWKSCLFSLAVVGMLIFIVGRIILLILIFTQLRSPPQLAFHTIQLTIHIPHL